ncbi:PKD domain-containing protein [Pseudoalteromonas ardens]|uniref:PKD domain-containing protein n=1 Tax=Pseudoalteromonas ardens TaxID=3048490 RepID=UPI0024C27263|nr:PKD domain-containing protein [Pseudoalteromonas sp. R96]MDK1310435.1 PKD domain-containing protein [Pseudoalteromonas sp. R96]
MYKVITGLLCFLTCTAVASDAQYFWRFGDGSVSHDAEPEHQYEQPGIYTVTREVYQDGKLLESSQKLVDLITPKISELVIVQPDQVVQGQSVEFMASLTSSEPLDLNYQWFVAGEPIASGSQTGKFTTQFAESGTVELSVDAMWQQTIVSSASTQLSVEQSESEKPDGEDGDGSDGDGENPGGDEGDNSDGGSDNGETPGKEDGNDNKTPGTGKSDDGGSGGSLHFLMLFLAGVCAIRRRS